METDIPQTPALPENKFERHSSGAQFLILLAIWGGCFFLAQIVAAAILLSAYGLDAKDMHSIVNAHGNLNPIRIAQMLATVISFAVPALVFSKLKTKSWTKFSGIQNHFPALLLILVPMLVITAYPMIYVSYFINQHAFFADWGTGMQEEYKFLIDALMGSTFVSILIINLFTIAIIPAMAEEWLFRGTMQPLLQKQTGPHMAILVTAFIFSFIHFEFSGFLPRMCLGILLGYIYYFSGSLWVSIWAHLFNNGMEVVLRFLKNTGRISMEIDDPALPKAWEIVAFTAVFAVLAYAFYFISRKKFDTFA